MVGPALAILVALASSQNAIESRHAADCTEWHACRELALAAADRADYETFHDLAWRAVQTGPPRDPALMYLLARAQALSGRPHDALVMLDRLAQMGIASDAATNDDFARTRQLPGWPDVAARIEALTGPAQTASPGTARPAARISAGAPRAAGFPARTSNSAASLPAAEAVRFGAGRFSPAGLAYDAVSRRFLFGDRFGRKLIVVGDGANHADDLVRSDSAGFQNIAAMEIDTRRGDLWVASTSAAGGSASLHKLQLVSGRPLRTIPVPAELEPATLVDLSVSAAGVVLALDSIGKRVLMLRPGETAVTSSAPVNGDEPTSLTASAEEGVAYVAHAGGISRVDLRARTASIVTPPRGVSLAHLERIRSYRNALIAVDVDADGSRRILRLDLNAAGRAIVRSTALEALAAPSAETFVSISGDDLLYLAAPTDPSAADVVTYRVRLR